MNPLPRGIRVYVGLLLVAWSVYMFRTGDASVEDYSKPKTVFGHRPRRKAGPFEAKVEALFTGVLGLMVAFVPGKDEV